MSNANSAQCATISGASKPAGDAPRNPIKESLSYLDKAGEFVKKAEAYYDNEFPVSAINEFRNVACHLARYIANGTDEGESVLRHAKKAYIDATEAYAMSLLECVRAYSDAFRGYSNVVHGYVKDYVDKKQSIVRMDDAFRSCCFGTEEERLERADAIAAEFQKVEQYLSEIRASEDAISDDVRQKKNAFRLTVLGILVLPIVLSAIGWILSIFL